MFSEPIAKVEVDGRSYAVYKENHSYDAALAFCESKKMKLLPIDIRTVLSFIKIFFPEKT